MALPNVLAILVVCSALVYVESCPAKFKDCGSVKGKVVSVGYNGTCQPDKLILKKKTYAQITIEFESDEVTSNLTTVVHGVVFGVPVSFDVDNPNACKNCGVTCPLAASKTYTYHNVIYVKPAYPSISVVVKWELQDTDNKDVVCIVIPAEIED